MAKNKKAKKTNSCNNSMNNSNSCHESNNNMNQNTLNKSNL